MDPASTDAEGTRRRVVVYAYACGPVDEPEAAAGWAFAAAAAKHHDVWVITRRRFRDSISDALVASAELAAHLHPVHVDLGAMRFKRGPGSVYWYYYLWQRAAARTAATMHSRSPFQLAHHVTFASDWLPSAALWGPRVPLVWGPVGGTTPIPWALSRFLGVRGLAREVFRQGVTSVARRVWGDRLSSRASLVLAQNGDVARRFAGARHVVTEPNAAFRDPVPELIAPPNRRVKSAVFVGRLIPLKGVRIALDVMADPRLLDWSLDIYGAGPELQALRARCERLRLTGRVRFLGHRPRPEVLDAMRRATVMLFPSMHDQAGWVAGEASAAGCPVVCLDVGGPPILAGPNALPVTPRGDVVDAMVRRVLESEQHTAVRYDRWQAERLPGLVKGWYDGIG